MVNFLNAKQLRLPDQVQCSSGALQAMVIGHGWAQRLVHGLQPGQKVMIGSSFAPHGGERSLSKVIHAAKVI